MSCLAPAGNSVPASPPGSLLPVRSRKRTSLGAWGLAAVRSALPASSFHLGRAWAAAVCFSWGARIQLPHAEASSETCIGCHRNNR